MLSTTAHSAILTTLDFCKVTIYIISMLRGSTAFFLNQGRFALHGTELPCVT